MNKVLRICASMTSLPREQCTIPERCIDEKCQECGATVHYDPQASIPALGTEFIVCDDCLAAVLPT